MPKPATCDCRVDVTYKLGLANYQSHTRVLTCFDSYVMRSPLPSQILTETRLGFLVGGQWGSENAWVSELRVSSRRATER